MTNLDFSQAEKRALAILQRDLPDSATPFRDVAERVGLSEDEVLALVRRLKEDGVIRRFGATLRHQKAGYGHNAMVAWKVPEERAEEVGKTLAARPEISHCYRRRTAEDWPYTHYTMLHGRNPGECRDLAARLAAELGLPDYDILESERELKKTSMVYFAPDDMEDANDPI
ncbi:winged helix-turn-helix transcriptional regulator [Desulfohalovibrio reitneri]|uniref:siroheme decarboxylase subunit beta n=1 Tax=Desulfohalovibrio reitneri TaxID=1307759 RepID=UPI00055492DB|nr:winged helix-turn-helix transcriptional regulator [Desulfohalovibrio reitneri]